MTTVDIGTTFPASYKAMYALSTTAEEAATTAGLDPKLVELVKIRASQINGCAFCLRMHVRDAIRHGETADRLAVVAGWWESQYFDAAERAALAIAERVTSISESGDAHESPAEGALDDAQIAAVTWLTIVINAWNRIAISSHYAVAP
ncbi:alkyl hydroperoxide reductase AhpD [Frondihabitans sucicola]|uniref:Alkyl hydroperoxide reductase AhpD n=1 Tax=Frondihabitans sucicola TaxID=1268041 RepID=A0ABM8GPB0_9MICO|nr:carboxymuconolactone decarboxylase family protein [Frondihabitans sucicola]BDZ50269.1 alkyl hydroperoxide reductase AhpD [Frondihabitans sucicola]